MFILFLLMCAVLVTANVVKNDNLKIWLIIGFSFAAGFYSHGHPEAFLPPEPHKTSKKLQSKPQSYDDYVQRIKQIKPFLQMEMKK